MIVLSLFDGISCARVALERAGHKVDRYFASEIDKYAIKIALKNYPDTVQLGDVRNIHMTNFGIEVDLPMSTMRTYGAVPDLIVGGSPCQGFSNAGKGLNFEDPRSKLFFEFVRIVNEVKVLNPRVKVMLENVDMKRRWRDIITKHLGMQPIFIDSKVLSAQQRQRWYWCNFIPKDKYFDVCHPKDRGMVLNDILQPEKEVDEKYYLSDKALSKIKTKHFTQNYRDIEDKAHSQLAGNGSPLRSNNTLIQRARGKNKGGEHSEKSTTVTSNRWEQNNYIKISKSGELKNDQEKASCFTAGAHSGGNHSDMDLLIVNDPIQLNEMIEFGNQPRQQNRVYDVNGKSPAHLAMMSSGTHAIRIGSLYDSGGEGGRIYSTNGKSKTIKSPTGGQGTSTGLYDVGRIRRLTPIEVERLFGLPDNYTEGISDSQRYKSLGNGWQVDTVEHIFQYL